MIYTSNFARAKRLPDDIAPVCIAIKPPYWWKGEHYPKLAPTAAMLKMQPAAYNRHFAAILAKLEPGRVVQELTATFGEHVALLCWESPNVSCHRRYVAEWLENSLGLVVPEFGFEREAILPYTEMPHKQVRQKKSP